MSDFSFGRSNPPTTALGNGNGALDDRSALPRAEGGGGDRYHNGMAVGFDGFSLRIDRLAAEVLNVRNAVAALALTQGMTMLLVLSEVLARIF